MHKKVNENDCILSDYRNGRVEDWRTKTGEPKEKTKRWTQSAVCEMWIIRPFKEESVLSTSIHLYKSEIIQTWKKKHTILVFLLRIVKLVKVISYRNNYLPTLKISIMTFVKKEKYVKEQQLFPTDKEQASNFQYFEYL